MKQQLRATGRRLANLLAPTAMASISDAPRLRAQAQQATQRVGALRQRVQRLESRVNNLEAEVQEARQLNRRIAELTDVVQECLLTDADRDGARLKQSLDKYTDSF